MLKRLKYEKIWIIFCIFLITIIFLLPASTRASSLNTLSDRMSRQAPNIGSDHEIKFTTPSGLGESGQYLRIIFDSGFNLSGVDYTDIDLFHGQVTGLENQESLSGSANLNSWGATISGQQINLTHPLDNAIGDIAPNDKVIIKIGFNANGGNRQIINPITTGSKIITLSGNYGDNGKLAVAIFQDQIGVGGESENAPPNSVVLSSFISGSQTVTLNWTVNNDFDFDHYAVYSSLTSNLSMSTGSLESTISDRNTHNFIKANLEFNKTYYFKVYVFDKDNLWSASNEVLVIIKTNPYEPPPPPPPPPPEEEVPPEETPPEEEEPSLFEKIGDVSCDEGRCAYFSDDVLLSGAKPENTIVFVNKTNQGVIYPSDTRWSYPAVLEPGENFFEIYAQDPYGMISDYIVIDIKRYLVGDSNGDNVVDDFDLSTLVAHFGEPWCFSDFNGDNMVDDFDLSALASRWSGIY